MIGISSAYISGLFFASLIVGGSGTGFCMLVLAAAFAGIMYLRVRGAVFWSDVLLILISFCAAAAVFIGYTRYSADKIRSYAGSTGSFSGAVEDITLYEGGFASYILDGEIDGEQRARITVYINELDAEYGDRVNIDSCRFSIPEKDYLFDAQSYYRPERVFLSAGSVKGISVESLGKRRLKNLIMSYRSRMMMRFNSYLGEECGGFLSGMVFGEKQWIDRSTRTALYRSGIGHIMAVSGLHVSLAAAFLMFVLKWLRVNRAAAFVLLLVMISLLATAADSPASAVRAAIMTAILYLAWFLRRIGDSLNALAVTALVMCIHNPYVIYSPGFMLSLSGSFGAAAAAPYLTRNIPADTLKNRIIKSFMTAFYISLSVFPLSLYYFSEVSLISPLTNVIIIPLCTLAMLCGLIFVLTGGLLNFLPVVKPMISAVIFISDKISGAGVFTISSGGNILPPAAIACGAAVMTAYIISKDPVSVKHSMLITGAIFAVSAAVSAYIRWDTCTVAVLGKDSNAVVVVSCHGSADIIDLSGHYKSARYAARYLSEYGLTNIDSAALIKNVNSQYAAYANELGNEKPGYWVGSTEIICGEKIKKTTAGSFFTVSKGDYTINWQNDVLTVDTGELSITFAQAGYKAETESYPDSDLYVFYGKVPSGADTVPGAVYLAEAGTEAGYSGINNFTIVCDAIENGKVKLRRL